MALSTTIDIKSFDFNTIGEHPLIAFVAKRRAGKSSWMANFCKHMPSSRDGIVIAMCGSESTNIFWTKQGVQPLYVVEPSIEYLEKLKKTQNKKVIQLRAQGINTMPKKYHIYLILDDCSCITKLMKSAIFSYLASNGRHLSVTILISAQYLTHLPPDIRTNIDILVALATSHRRNIQKIHDEYASTSEPRVFRSVLSATTESWGALIINNTVPAVASITDNCYYSKIDKYPIPNQRFGSKSLNDYAKRHYINRERVLSMRERHSDITSDDDEGDHDDGDMFHTETMAMLDNRRIFTDSRGQIVIRKCAIPVQKKEKTE